MKQNLFKTMLLAVALFGAMGGVNVAFAGETIVKYARAIQADETNGYSAWSTNDVAKSGTNVWIGDFLFDSDKGLYGNGKGNRTSYMTFDHSKNSKQIIELEINTLNNIGDAGNYSYFKIGDAIEIQSNQQNQTGCVIINGEVKNINNCNLKYYNRNNDIWTVKAVINTATGTLESFSLKGLTMNKKTASLEINKEMSLGQATDYNKVTIGFIRKNGTPSLALKSIKITEEEQSVSTADYTVNYQFDGTTINSVTGINNVGTTIYAESPITIDGQKYYFADGATTSMELGSSENILNVALRKANNYNYSVTTNLGTTISEGICIEGDNVTVPYSHFINVDGKLYSYGVTDKEYRLTITPNVDGFNKTLDYSDAKIDNVVYYSEGENIEGAVVTSAGNNMVVRSSNAACGYAPNDIELVNLTPGKYEVTSFTYANNKVGCTLSFAYGDEAYDHVVTDMSNGDTKSQIIVVNKACPFVWKKSGDAKNGLDYIYIRRISDLAPISSAKFATYSPSSNVTVPAEESGIKVYTAKVEGNQINLTQVEAGKVLKAGTGYVIAGEEKSYEFALTNDAAKAIEGNDLKVATGEGLTATADTKYYVLTKRAEGVGFGKVADGVNIPAGKCYIDLSETASKATFLSFGGETTCISNVNAAKANANEYFSLQGVKTMKPNKGIYIHNGKKVVIK